MSGSPGGILEPVLADRDACRRRLAALRRGLQAHPGVRAALVTGPGAVAALTGVWLETGTVMPDRNPWLLVGPDGPPRLLAHELELELVRRRWVGEPVDLVPVADRSGRRRAVRGWLAGCGAAGRLGLDGTGLPVRDQPLPAGVEWVDVSDRLPGLLRGRSAPELAQVRAAAGGLRQAVDRVLAGPRSPADTECELAARLAAETLRTSGDWYDLVPIVSSGPRLQVPHARPAAVAPAAGDLCRVGVRARYGPHHLMCVRSAVAGDGGFRTVDGICGRAAADGRTLVRALHPGASYRQLVRALPRRAGRLPVPPAQGIGFEFREPPLLDPHHEDVVADGDVVLASVVLADGSGARAYWQDVVPVGTGAAGEPG